MKLNKEQYTKLISCYYGETYFIKNGVKIELSEFEKRMITDFILHERFHKKGDKNE